MPHLSGICLMRLYGFWTFLGKVMKALHPPPLSPKFLVPAPMLKKFRPSSRAYSNYTSILPILEPPLTISVHCHLFDDLLRIYNIAKAICTNFQRTCSVFTQISKSVTRSLILCPRGLQRGNSIELVELLF